MIPLILASLVSFLFTIIFTPLFIKFQRTHQLGQFVRQDGPSSHYTKAGTPTMGGVVIVLALVLGYATSAIYNFIRFRLTPSPAPLLLILLIVLMGLIGFIDDFKKFRHSQSEGLKPREKIALQIIFGTIIGILSIYWQDDNGVAPAHINSWLKIFSIISTPATFSKILIFIFFIIWINFLLICWTNALNLTDGLDGLASGASIFAFGSYIIISFWQSGHNCFSRSMYEGPCYQVSHPFELGIIAATIMASSIGFLWFNAAPAKIFMGDTGSLALGGAFAGISIFTDTQFIAVIIGFIFVMEIGSGLIQLASFKLRHKRVFRMAPIHHHFELKGWQEITVVVRFWIISIIVSASGVGLFYLLWIFGWV